MTEEKKDWIEDLEAIKQNSKETSEEKKKPAYKSKEGFVEKRILRGFFEIERLLEDIRNVSNGFICGGYVRWMASEHKNPVHAGDVDVYCYDDSDFTKLKEFFEKTRGLEIRFENNISITYKKPESSTHIYFAAPIIQLIKPVQEGAVVAKGDMKTVLENFDFTVVRCGLISKEVALVDADFEHDEPNQILRLKNIHCPISSTMRCMKYSRKGYWLPPAQALKLFLDWERRDDDYRLKIKDFIEKANDGEGLTKTEIDELEAMMRID